MAQPPGDLIVVTGMTGAGRSTAAKALEDVGWFVIDNLPPQLLQTVLQLIGDEDDSPTRIAVVVDVRSRGFFADLRGALSELIEQGVQPRLLFLEASDDVLVRRQEAARRPHPLQGGMRLLDGIAREREMVRDLRGDADVLIDTSNLNVHQLASRVEAAFSAGDDVGACAPRSSRSASSTASRSTRTWSSTCASCPIRIGCPNCGR